MGHLPSKLKVLVGLLVVVAVFTVVDPHRTVLDDETRFVVQPNMEPSQIWDHAQLNTLQTSYTATLRIWPAGDDEFHLKWITEYNPDAYRYLGRIYSQADGTENWTSEQVFLGEAVKATRLGDTNEPTVSSHLSDPLIRSRATPDGFEPRDSVADPDLDADEFRLLNSTDTQVIIGVTDAGNYADLHNLDEEQVLRGSDYRVFIDRDAGRISRIVDRRRIADPGASEPAIDTRRVWTFTRYGTTSAHRPGWARWHPLELVYDALSL